MATIGTSVTYLDITSRLGPDDKIGAVIELTSRTNAILTDMRVVEGNLPTGHRTTVRTGLPTATWRILGYGVPKSKSITSQITDTTGMLEAYAEVDKEMVTLNNNLAAWRLSEDQAFLESMNQEMATTVFYGNQSADPSKFTGLMPRYPQFGTAASALNVTARNCIAAHAGSGSVQTSMWLVVWGDNTVHGIYPKGSTTGGFMKEGGEKQETLQDADGNNYEGYRTHYQWKLGLTVRDWRYAVRICNIDTALLSSTVVDLFRAMTAAYFRIPAFGMGTPVFYANSLVLEFLTVQAMAKTNAALSYSEASGNIGPVTKFMGIPIRRCDALINTEALAVTI